MERMYKNGFIKIASVTPKLTVGNPLSNVKEMLLILEDMKASIALFPELGVTAYTCNDLFFHEGLLHNSEKAVEYLLEHHHFEGLIVIGAPLEVDGVLYNCAFVIQGKKILGIVPKFYLPNTGEFYEKRWFQSGFNIIKHQKDVQYLGKTVPFGYLIFKNQLDTVSFGIEVCEDMWAPISPGNILSLNGARIILNLSASNEVLGKREIRRRAILEHSRRNAGAYVYSSAGVNESSSETVFSGHNLIAQNSDLIVETENFNQESEVLYGDIDLDKIDFSRRTNASYRDSLNQYRFEVQEIIVDFKETKDYTFAKKFDRTPFVPKKHVVADFEKGKKEHPLGNVTPYKGRPDKLPGVYENLDPIDSSIESVNKLLIHPDFDVYFLSTAPWDNPDSWTHKRLWVAKHFDEKLIRMYTLDMLKNMLSPICYIKYKREAFKDELDNLRVTFDHSLNVERYTGHENEMEMKLLLDTNLIMEVKFEHYMPRTIREILKKISLNQINTVTGDIKGNYSKILQKTNNFSIAPGFTIFK